jgi:hypothetical protein
VHHEAPAAAMLKRECPHPRLWFVTILPFDDGNGRIARFWEKYARVGNRQYCYPLAITDFASPT